MDEVIERLAGGEVRSDDQVQSLILVMLARLVMMQTVQTQMLADALAMERDEDEARPASYGGLDG